MAIDPILADPLVKSRLSHAKIVLGNVAEHFDYDITLVVECPLVRATFFNVFILAKRLAAVGRTTSAPATGFVEVSHSLQLGLIRPLSLGKCDSKPTLRVAIFGRRVAGISRIRILIVRSDFQVRDQRETENHHGQPDHVHLELLKNVTVIANAFETPLRHPRQ